MLTCHGLPSFVLWVDRYDPQCGTIHTTVVDQMLMVLDQDGQYQSSPLYHPHPYTTSETAALRAKFNTQ